MRFCAIQSLQSSFLHQASAARANCVMLAEAGARRTRIEPPKTCSLEKAGYQPLCGML
jgi:hypothetical protein